MDIVKIRVYTDGACSGNPGPGGWGALILVKGGGMKEKFVLRGGEKDTTNNQMELFAVIEAMDFVYNNLIKNKYERKDYNLSIHSDSSYVVNTINQNWLGKWMTNGWKSSKGTAIVNRGLWEELAKIANKVEATMIKVKGHSGHKFNDYVDKVAVEESIKYQRIANKF